MLCSNARGLGAKRGVATVEDPRLGSIAVMLDPPVLERSSPRADIRALLLIALDDKPPDNLPDRVMARVAMLMTVVEFGRLLSAAPLEWLSQAMRPKGEEDDDGSSSGPGK